MKEGREYVDYLRDILDAITKAQQFIEGMGFDSFCSDDKTVFAVVRARLSPSTVGRMLAQKGLYDLKN